MTEKGCYPMLILKVQKGNDYMHAADELEQGLLNYTVGITAEGTGLEIFY